MTTDNESSPDGAVMLQSEAHEELLNAIDSLRSQGISRFLDLPQLIVCGDQSSGKSSVLEALSGVRFPVKDNVCTRFATELILRRGPDAPATVTIIPANDRPEHVHAKLGAFKAEANSMEDIPVIIDSAKDLMGINDDSRSFSDDILRIEMPGPYQPHLTLVDLPGLYHAGNKKQSVQESEVVRSLVSSYMRKQRSIILAVVSAKNDYANQIITKYAREVDPSGIRTLGVITKPDTLHAGSDSERAFFELAGNKDVYFQLGWHVLVNRDFNTRDASASERDGAERAFLNTGLWAALPASSKGITALKPRLSSVLRNQILNELPNLIRDVQLGINDCFARLARLGDSRANIKEQREYLQRIGTEFTNIMRASVDGIYNHEFFTSAHEDQGYDKRLRAKLQNICLGFADYMRENGHHKQLYSKGHIDQLPHRDPKAPIPTWRDDYLAVVQHIMARSRGSELPGIFNPQIIVELFFEQSQKWEAIVAQLVTDVLEAASTTIDLILEHVADGQTIDKLLRYIINPAMAQVKQKLGKKITGLLEPHQRGHLMTYNHYFTENLNKARQDAFSKSLDLKIRGFFASKLAFSGDYVNGANFSIKELQAAITKETEKSMDLHACSDATDVMLAYYKVRAF